MCDVLSRSTRFGPFDSEFCKWERNEENVRWGFWHRRMCNEPFLLSSYQIVSSSHFADVNGKRLQTTESIKVASIIHETTHCTGRVTARYSNYITQIIIIIYLRFINDSGISIMTSRCMCAHLYVRACHVKCTGNIVVPHTDSNIRMAIIIHVISMIFSLTSLPAKL